MRKQASRASLNAHIKFGMLNIGISGYNAVANEAKVDFTTLSTCCHAKRKQKYECSECGEESPRSETIKAYELEKPKKSNDKKGKYLEIDEKSDEYLKSLKKSRSDIQIVDFCDRSDVDDLFFDSKQYYLEPKLGSEKTFSLLYKAMKSKGKVAIAKGVLSNKEEYMLLQVYDNCIMIRTLSYFEGRRLPIDVEMAEVSEDELKLAEQLIDKMSVGFNLAEVKDEYLEAAKDVITKIMNDETDMIQIEIPEVKDTGAGDVMDELRASLQLMDVKREEITVTA
jgi:DNA end-binding protein Ku